MRKRLLTHIINASKHVSLKIYEICPDNEIKFLCAFFDDDGDCYAELTLSFTVASLLFKGLNEIFEENDSDDLDGSDNSKKKKQKEDEKDDYQADFEKFFNLLKKNDKDYFSLK